MLAERGTKVVIAAQIRSPLKQPRYRASHKKESEHQVWQEGFHT